MPAFILDLVLLLIKDWMHLVQVAILVH